MDFQHSVQLIQQSLERLNKKLDKIDEKLDRQNLKMARLETEHAWIKRGLFTSGTVLLGLVVSFVKKQFTL